METPAFSLFEGGIKNATPTGTTTIADVLEAIRNDQDLSMRIDIIRNLDGENRQREKSTLPYVTFSGRFKYRNREHLEEYTGLICIDIDHIEHEKIEEIKGALQDDDILNVLLCFVSPSGEGLKVVLPTDNYPDNHVLWFNYYSSYFKKMFDVEVDKACKDITRACYLSHDPDAFAFAFEGYQEMATLVSPEGEKKKMTKLVTLQEMKNMVMSNFR